jgi:hypothetical protein
MLKFEPILNAFTPQFSLIQYLTRGAALLCPGLNYPRLSALKTITQVYIIAQQAPIDLIIS